MKREFEVSKDTRLVDLIVEKMAYASMNRGRKTIKSGCVKVNNEVITYPNTKVKAGVKVEVFDQPVITNEVQRKLPFPILFENDELLAIEKPAGMISASPDKRKRSAFTIAKNWLKTVQPQLEDIYFINKLPKEASGILLIAKSAVIRARLQEHWNRFPKKYYVLAQGQFDDHGELGGRAKARDDDQFVFPYRTMTHGRGFTLLKVEMEKEAFSELFSTMEAKGTPVPGHARRGKAADPLGRLGLHFFSVELEMPQGDKITVKTRVPRDFLRLVKHQNV